MKNTSIQPETANYKALEGQVSVDEAKGIVECFVAAVGNKDSVGDIVLPGAFNASLKRRKPRVVWGHNWNEPIGKVLDIFEVGPNDPRLPLKMKSGGVGGLYARVQFNLKSERGREAFANVTFFGKEQEWSIGYKTLDAVYDPAQKANLLKEVELYEVSPVLHGANQLTGTISIKSDKQVEEKSALKDPKGGLTAAGREHFKRTEGANLKPGVKGPADTPEKMRRKGSFLTRFFTNPRGPMQDEKGRPTRLALSAAAWGEPVPQDRSDAAKLAAKGRRLLERYENSKKKSIEEDIEVKMHLNDTYAAAITLARPEDQQRMLLTQAVTRHFGGPCRIAYADPGVLVVEMRKDGVDQTLRIPYKSDGMDYMFGTAEPVKPRTIYVPDTNSEAFGWNESPEKRGDGDGCGCDSCGKPMPSWETFKQHNPGKHLFVHSADDVGLFGEINKFSGQKELDVELLDVGIAIKNINSLDMGSYEELIELIDGFEEKKLRAIGRTGRGISARFDANARDADGDLLVQEGTVYERPAKPRMMPSVPQEIPQPEKVPEPVPQKEPSRPKTPSRPTPIPVPTTPTPARPRVPVGLTGATTSGTNLSSANLNTNLLSANLNAMSRRQKLDKMIYDRLRSPKESNMLYERDMDRIAKELKISKTKIRAAEERHMEFLKNANIEIQDPPSWSYPRSATSRRLRDAAWERERKRRRNMRKLDGLIYDQRMAGASLEELAKKYKTTREKIRRIEQRFMYYLRTQDNYRPENNYPDVVPSDW